jgi:hypothetical protein
MSFKDEMNNIAKHHNKDNYEQLKDKIKLKAENGEFSTIIYEDEVLNDDIIKLREIDKLDIEFVKGEDFNYYNISWY